MRDGRNDQKGSEPIRRRSRSPPSRTSNTSSNNNTKSTDTRWDDPMNQFSEKRKAEKADKISKYRAPPNRFNIPPGRQWDGIDRSNGFEVAYFKKLAGEAVKKDLDYKYTVADM